MDYKIKALLFGLFLLRAAPLLYAHAPQPSDFTVLAESALLEQSIEEGQILELEFFIDPESAAVEENIVRIYLYPDERKRKIGRPIIFLEAYHESCAASTSVMISIQDKRGNYSYHDFPNKVSINDTFRVSIEMKEKKRKGLYNHRIELNDQVVELPFPQKIYAIEVVNVHGKSTLNKLEIIE